MNTDRFRPVSREESERLREKHGFGAGEFILVYPAELNGNKNQGLLIETAALLKNRIPELKLVFAGEGAMEEPYRKRLNHSVYPTWCGFTVFAAIFMN